MSESAPTRSGPGLRLAIFRFLMLAIVNAVLVGINFGGGTPRTIYDEFLLLISIILLVLLPLFRSLTREHPDELLRPGQLPVFWLVAHLPYLILVWVAPTEGDYLAQLTKTLFALGAALIVGVVAESSHRTFLVVRAAEIGGNMRSRQRSREAALHAITLARITAGAGLMLLAVTVEQVRDHETAEPLVVLCAVLAPVLITTIGVSWLGYDLFRGFQLSELRLGRFLRRLARAPIGPTVPPTIPEPALRATSEAISGWAGRASQEAQADQEARRGLEDLQRSKMLFMASMSHDLRNPLNAILGFSEFLLAGDGLNEGQRESVRTIASSGEELLALLNDILDSARHEVGRLPLRKAWTPSVEILTEAVRRGEDLIRDKPLTIHAELQPGLPPVYADRERIVQAVVCLLRHAVRAMDKGTVQLTAQVFEGATPQMRVQVIDASEGIRAADRARIFQAFREVMAPSGRRYGGLGLGLSLAQSLVSAHGGEIFCESREHRGTTFTVALPLSGPESTGRRSMVAKEVS